MIVLYSYTFKFQCCDDVLNENFPLIKIPVCVAACIQFKIPNKAQYKPHS